MSPLHAELRASLTTVSRLHSKAVKDGTLIASGRALQRFVHKIQLHHPSVDDFRQFQLLLCSHADVFYGETPRRDHALRCSVLSTLYKTLTSRGKLNLSIAFSLCFHGQFQAQKSIAVRFGDLTLTGEPRLDSLHRPARAGLLVCDAKPGRRQFVALSDKSSLSRIQIWSNSNRFSPNDVLFRIPYFALSKAFEQALAPCSL